MHKVKQWVALTVVGCLALVAGGWFLLVSPKRTEAADIRVQAAEQEAKNSTLRTELEVLRAQARDLPKEQAKLASVATKIPDNPALPGLIRQLIEAAAGADVELVSVSPTEPALVAPAAPPAPQAPAAGQAGPDATGDAATASEPAAAPANPAGQLAKIGLSVNVVGDYFEVQRFVAALEQLSRAVLVETISMAPGSSPTASTSGAAAEDGRSLAATLSGSVFMAANRPAPVTTSVPADAVADAAAPTADAAS